MADEKDRLGQKLRDKGKTEEDRYFAQQEQAALEKLRLRRATGEKAEAGRAGDGLCPKCVAPLVSVEEHGVTFERCPACEGIWLDKGELERLAERKRDSWLARYLLRTRA